MFFEEVLIFGVGITLVQIIGQHESKIMLKREGENNLRLLLNGLLICHLQTVKKNIIKNVEKQELYEGYSVKPS